MFVSNLQSNGLEDPKLWESTFFTTTDHLARFMDIPLQSLKRKERFSQAKVQTRLLEVHAILRRVRPWFDSDQAAWAWYISEPLASFANLTPAEIIKLHKGKGVEGINDFITAKELGGFD